MTADKITKRTKQSKSRRGGHLAPDPLPEVLPWNDENAPLLFEYLGRIRSPAEVLADQMAAFGRIGRECLADQTQPEGAPTRHWANELLGAIADWRAVDDAASQALAAFRAGEAWALLQVCARASGKQRTASGEGIKGKATTAISRMADLRSRMAKLPPQCLRDAPTVRKALLAAGWKPPWTDRVTEDRIRAVLREPASKTR